MFNKRLYYTDHAREMLPYGLTVTEVKYCLNNYDTRYSTRTGKLIYEANLPDGRRIKVYLEEKSSDAKVITVTEKGSG
jgi:hypothetical protein